MQKKEQGTTGNKFLAFMKRNIYYILMIVCVLAIAAVVTTVAVLNTGDKDVEVDVNPDTPVVQPDDGNGDVTPPVVEQKYALTMPVVGGVSGKAFSPDELVWNDIREYETHQGLDINCEIGASVMAGFSGVIESIEDDRSGSNVITIKNNDKYTTVFRRVDDVCVKVGQEVQANTVIGKANENSRDEYIESTPHIHIEVRENGNLVNPADYLVGEDK